ncbi:MAG: enoyl-CoA hydratase-related protein [Rubrivivax sp.]
MALNLPASVRYEKRDRIAVITMNRPEAMNSLTKEMLIGLEAAFDDFEADPALRVAIFTGAGERAFCTGLDLKVAMPALTEGDSMGYDDPAKRPFQRNYKPIITAVNGMCVAGGLEFMLGTDIRVAASHAKFGLAEVRWAVVPAGGSHIRLPQQIPWAIAMEMLLTGNTIDAQRAYEIGLVNKVVAPERLMDEALAYAERICENGPLAVRTAKEIAVRALNNEPAFVLEKTMAARVFGSADAQEGPRAFAEKRKPEYSGR